MTTAPLCEIFTSFQGEGPFVGVRQIFVRVRGCDLTCLYCDTRNSHTLTGTCRMESLPGIERFTELENPLCADAVLQKIISAHRQANYPLSAIHSLALTGGEPLLYPDFTLELAGLAKAHGLPLYLETAGHKPVELARVVEQIEFVSLDFKLPSTLARPVDTKLFVQSFEVAQGHPHWIKIVFAAETPVVEIEQAASALAKVYSKSILILQPLTALKDVVNPALTPPAVPQIEAAFHAAAKFMRDVRVIPQCHHLLGVL